MKDKHTKMPRGFGFVTFSDPSVIDKVLEDEHNIDGRTVEVKRTVPREEMSSKDGPKTRKIFVGGLPSTLTEDDLRDHFSSYGNVVEHQIMVDHSTGRSRGFGFVTFESEDSVERVISEGRMRDLGGKQVEIKKAEPKKHGGDHSSNGRSSHSGGGGYRSSYRSGGAAGSYYDSTGYGYGRGGYGAAAAAAAYGGNAGYGSGFGGGYGGSMYGGAYGAYGAYGGGAYGAGAYGGGAYGAGAYGGGAYGAGGYGAGGYGSYGGAGAGAGGAGGGGGGSAGGRGSSRYHPYGK
uniref:RRM domain-containing protein n=1 Tax=Aegilops tauschii subsp. strangulata TaxID=200361 RepID=A0A453NSG8_AEGTS